MKQNGQVILIVLIISALIMTIGLSMSRKAVVETKIDTDEELLKQAFNTAESGVDYYLGTGSTNYVAPDTTKKADVAVNAISAGATGIDFNEFYLSNNAATFWLAAHNANGDIDYSTYYSANNLNICLLNAFTGSLKVDLFYKNGASYGVSRQGYNLGASPTVTGYTDATGASQGACPAGRKAINLANIGVGSTPVLLSIYPIFQPGTKISLVGSAGFPSQGNEISSTGKAGDLQAGVNRKVTVQNRYRVAPFMFEAITAGNSVVNN